MPRAFVACVPHESRVLLKYRILHWAVRSGDAGLASWCGGYFKGRRGRQGQAGRLADTAALPALRMMVPLAQRHSWYEQLAVSGVGL